jgi:drug/metabolite transporter (DMT)-like permease
MAAPTLGAHRAAIGDWIRRTPAVLLPFPPLFWAGNLLIGRAFAKQLPPFGLTWSRWSIALVVLLPFVWRGLWRERRILLRHWWVVAALGLSGFAGYPVLNYIALHTTVAATAAILNSMLPLMVPVFAWIIAGERPSPRVGLAIAISLVGVLTIVSRGDPSVITSLRFGIGEILVLLAVACYAFYSVILRFAPRSVPQLVFLAATFIPAIAVLTPLWLWELTSGRTLPLQPYSIASVLFIGIFASLVANFLWNRSVATVGSTITGASFHLMAIYSAVLAFVLLGEPVHLFHLVGIALILTGFALAALPRRSAPMVAPGVVPAAAGGLGPDGAKDLG